ncbi:hypothetical protein EC844_10231 [Acinetobacter calcoaceticus]|uniref:Lipoprotein n=1 Tax=Acinetobacter calcoaceticus TaxID=471 RepID=A0A4R1Y2A1_ACICA|nr:hypothetical protein EC844_10231 [Acinetobacter calcoaceticus]
MKKILCISLACTSIIACGQQPTTAEQADSLAISTVETHSRAVIDPDTIPTSVAESKLLDPKKTTIVALVNNPAALPQGYSIDTTHLKKPLLLDLNGDGKQDAFQVLKNPNKKGMQYLFEFRIADSEQVYYYENDEPDYDLDVFGGFDIAQKNEVFVDQMLTDSDDLVGPEHAPEKAKIYLEHQGLVANLTEETCGSSLFYLKNNQIKRVSLC